jgi:predicted site-specific integrase-resolvase
MENRTPMPRLIAFNKWLDQMGVTPTTGWRWRKKGILRTTNIYGRLYLTEEAVAEFHRRATAGEFAIEVKPGKRPASN